MKDSRWIGTVIGFCVAGALIGMLHSKMTKMERRLAVIEDAQGIHECVCSCPGDTLEDCERVVRGHCDALLGIGIITKEKTR